MKLVVAGLGRTGTISIVQALDQLGLRTVSQREVFDHIGLFEDLNRAARGDAPFDWARLAGADATVGWPLCYLFAEQLAHWPEATCLLNVRDADAWFDSIERAWPLLSLVRRGRWGRKPRAVNGMIDLLMDRMGGPSDRGRWSEGYLAWLDHVRASVPAERLVEYEIGAGWEPICTALGRPVPDTPFPRSNTSGSRMLRDRIVEIVRPRAVTRS